MALHRTGHRLRTCRRCATRSIPNLFDLSNPDQRLEAFASSRFGSPAQRRTDHRPLFACAQPGPDLVSEVSLYSTYKTWKNFDLTIPGIEAGTQQSVLKAALINTLNPNPYIFWSLVTGPILLTGWHEIPVYGLGFVAAFYATMLLSLSLMILVFGFARQLGPKVNRILLGVSAIALFCFGLIQLWLGLKT